MKRFLLAGSLAAFALMYGCQQNNTKETNTDAANADTEAVMYQPYELASLMRSMYDDNMELKEQIEQGIIPASFPEDFYKIHTAEATKPENINDTYKALADKYLADMENVVASDEASVKRNFNEMVNTCISCHQIFCQGPIAKIKKLTIAE
jgi:hypothetical protein